MVVQLRLITRTNRAQQIIDDAGASPLLRIYSGTLPTNADTALSGNTLLAGMTLPATWATAASGVLTKDGVWSDPTADVSGTATFFRLFNSTGTVCILQGTVGVSGADLNLSSVSIVVNGAVTVTSMTITEGNA